MITLWKKIGRVVIQKHVAAVCDAKWDIVCVGFRMSYNLLLS